MSGGSRVLEARAVTEATAWDGLVAANPFGHPLQCWGWGEVKRASGWKADRIAVFDGAELRAAAQVLTRPLPGIPLSMTYVPRGPVVRPDDGEALAALALALRQHGRSRRSIFCKVDPAWPAGTAHALSKGKFRASAENIQVTDTYTIDLRQSEDEILGGMR